MNNLTNHTTRTHTTTEFEAKRLNMTEAECDADNLDQIIAYCERRIERLERDGDPRNESMHYRKMIDMANGVFE